MIPSLTAWPPSIPFCSLCSISTSPQCQPTRSDAGHQASDQDDVLPVGWKELSAEVYRVADEGKQKASSDGQGNLPQFITPKPDERTCEHLRETVDGDD